MQSVSDEDNLHEMSNRVFWKKKISKMPSSAESTQRMVKVKGLISTEIVEATFDIKYDVCFKPFI